MKNNPLVPDDPLELGSDLLRFIENIARFYEGYGLPRIGGRIFGLFLVTSTPLSAEQIAQVVRASRSSVSTNIRGLVANGWLEKITFPGDRVEYYRFAPDAWEHVMERRLQGIVPLKTIAEQAHRVLPSDHPARTQLEDMIAWTDIQVEHHQALITHWRQRQAERQTQAADTPKPKEQL